MSFILKNIESIGIIATYYCSINCKHCSHNASNNSKKEFVSEAMLSKILKTLKHTGCQSVHVEGGEPFLFINELIKSVKQINDSNISLEYVVTNCSWYKNQKDTIEILSKLRKAGLKRLLLKTGPFQNQHIPLRKVQNIQKAAKKAQIHTLIWDMQLYTDVAAFDPKKTHSLKQYEQKYGSGYLKKTISQMPINFSGRAFSAYEQYLNKVSTRKLLENKKNCKDKFYASQHFHVDLHGNFIFPYTQGITINIDDVGKKVSEEKYQILNMLYNEGLHKLLDFAKIKYKFKPKKEYISRCHLCYDIRTFLVKNKNLNTSDLKPSEFYMLS